MNSLIIHNLIEGFSSESLIDFFREKTSSFTPLLNDISSENPDFTNGQLVGVFTTDNGNFGRDNVAVFTFKTQKPLNERSGKKAQYEVAKKILKNNPGYTAGIFVFYDDKGDFRFSLVYDIITDTAKRQWSNFRRFTYFVSKEQTNKTFIKQITEADFSTLNSIIKAFSVEPVTRQFYNEIQNWYFWAQDKINFPDDYKYHDDKTKDAEIRNATNLIRLITRIIFIWFLKQKKLIPDRLFNEDELKNILTDFNQNPQSCSYYNAILQNLFFGTLNQKMNERKFADEGDISVNKKEYGVKNLYRYAHQFAIDKEEVIKIFAGIPFLNGGLFDCLDKEDDSGKVIYVDGFSRNPAKQAIVPDYLFFLNDEKDVDLSSFGLSDHRKVRGLMEILKSYSFTIDENTPTDQEVALDPELLGKVFENLLAAYNPETSSTARKATGSYYTPREIVDYMVQQSVKHYLLSQLQVDEEALDLLLSHSDEMPNLPDNIKRKIIELVDSIKILDPACGSGAFPMGLLHQLVFILQKLDPDNKVWYELQYNKALKETQEAFRHTDKNEREEILKEINESFDESINYPDYARKLYLIENCIYGVDIQPIAIQISKLRFFISLVLDQKVDSTKENLGIRALPNLETKFVAANTLIQLEKPYGTYYTDDIKKIENDIKQLRHKYFTSKTRNEKIQYQQQDKNLRLQLAQKLQQIGFPRNASEEIVKFDPYNPNASAAWFDPEWMFGVIDGFDIVIGNPPYIQLQKAADSKNKYADFYKDQKFETFERTGDIYCLFYEKGLQLLKPDGILAYITSNKWMRAGYGESLRKFFLKYNPKILIDLGPGVFENATVDTNIIIIQKCANQNALRAVTITEKNKESVNFGQIIENQGVVLNNLSKDAWFIGSDAEQRLKEKIERIGKPLKEWDVKIYYGIKTGLNEAFIITTEKRNEILANCRDEDERLRTENIIKPILRGRDIKRYYYEWAGLWVIGTFPALHLNIDDFPAIKKYFMDNFDIRQLEQSGKKYPELGFDARKKTGNKWFETQDQIAYYPEFEKEKVVYSEIVRQPQFYFDTENFYVEATNFLMTGDRVQYICGLLNSKPVSFFFKEWYAGGGLGEEGYRYKKAFIENLPLPPITPANQPMVSQIESLVDRILEAKKQDKNADTSQWEREIDKLVYKLYELTEEEIKIIEGGK